MRALPLLLALALSLGCATIETSRALREAEASLEGARAAGAEKQAPYEFASAEAYLKKAREEEGLARYRAAADYATRAARLADDARTRAARPEAR